MQIITNNQQQITVTEYFHAASFFKNGRETCKLLAFTDEDALVDELKKHMNFEILS